MLFRNSTLAIFPALLPVLLVAGAANAASISYYLDQSNTSAATDPDGALPDGNNYLKITFADSTTVSGDIDVTVELLAPLMTIADANFGIQKFLFNSANTLSASNIIELPADWMASFDYTPPLMQADGFGMFEVEIANTGLVRQDPLSFSIRIAGDSIYDYAELATGNGGEGDSYFAVHVAGFLDQASGDVVLTSAFFGGDTVVPEPATALLVLGGLSGLAAWRRPCLS